MRVCVCEHIYKVEIKVALKSTNRGLDRPVSLKDKNTWPVC